MKHTLISAGVLLCYLTLTSWCWLVHSWQEWECLDIVAQLYFRHIGASSYPHYRCTKCGYFWR